MNQIQTLKHLLAEIHTNIVVLGYLCAASADAVRKQVDETVTTMYPLLETALEDINTQLHYISSVDDITPSGDSTYTTRLIIDSIRNALKDAVIKQLPALQTS